jgi:hypothetical protein
VYGAMTDANREDIWLLSMGDLRTAPYMTTPYNDIQAKVSPDNRWLAYASDESGAWEVYVQTFPEPGRKQRVSPAGGAQPFWRADGRELFYLAADRYLMVAPVRNGPTMEVGIPARLFDTSVPAALETYRNVYTVSPNGQQFLIDAAAPGDATIEVIHNWRSLLPR